MNVRSGSWLSPNKVVHLLWGRHCMTCGKPHPEAQVVRPYQEGR